MPPGAALSDPRRQRYRVRRRDREKSTKNDPKKDKTVTIELFDKWKKQIYIPNGYVRPKFIDKINYRTIFRYLPKVKVSIKAGVMIVTNLK